MTIGTPPVSKEKLPDLSMKPETPDFIFRVCGYTPYPKISQALASPNFGFFGDKHKIEN